MAGAAAAAGLKRVASSAAHRAPGASKATRGDPPPPPRCDDATQGALHFARRASRLNAKPRPALRRSAPDADEEDGDDDVGGGDGDDEEAAKARYYHPGKSEVDEASFEDWDERCHGPMDSKTNRRQFPECFIWSCCGGTLESRGCTRREAGVPRVPGDNGSISSDTSSGVDRAGHDGELEVVWESWPDHDEYIHGAIDTAENRRDYPDGFRWTCCGKQADGSPCCIASDDDEEEEDEEDDEEDGYY